MHGVYMAASAFKFPINNVFKRRVCDAATCARRRHNIKQNISADTRFCRQCSGFKRARKDRADERLQTGFYGLPHASVTSHVVNGF